MVGIGHGTLSAKVPSQLWSVSFCLALLAGGHVSKVHCRSAFDPGASGLPSYCTPLVCVPAVIGGLAVWRHNNKQKKEHCSVVCLT